jgi:hypothetical protein
MARLRRQWGEDSTVTIDLSSGGSITLSFKGNMFEMSEDEQKLITDLTAMIRQYRDAQSASLNEKAEKAEVKSYLEAQRA